MAVFWLFLACSLVMFLQGLILGKYSLRKLDYDRHFSTGTCYAGDWIEMVEVIGNNRRIPIPWLRLEAMLPASLGFKRSKETWVSEGEIYQNHTSFFSLLARTRITRTHRVQCRSRGIFRMDTATMTGSDLFAIYMPSLKVTLRKRLVVYPSLRSDEELPSSWKTWQGELAVRRWIIEDPFLFTGVRSYAPGDAMNRIHWKASARIGELQVHQHGYSADPKAMILLNIEVTEQMWNVVTKPEVIEEALSYAATCTAALIHQGMAAGFASNAYLSPDTDARLARLAPAYGLPHLEDLLEAMAAVEMKVFRPFHELLRLEAEAEVSETIDYLLVTPHLSKAIREAIHLLEMKGHRVSIADLNEGLKGAGA
ncbi:DUF58 domain-containing protein [Paenibacillus sp.]|jgi:uncharacterized protein (DUF58 family)|uniref:DUF58 domain-containing protein n=1 Tax=Paenibacillus sp. TaxID=58172 RepID=UPI00281EF430|nr:DUF58 domain-containing protein [Paenibacillus sp.]MDR0270408.1 DUF58 domain-containing protein [Paenibacillus sp.]